jgi:hypothetical protein
MVRALYVCELGHIFRSAVKVKTVRLCPHCYAKVPNSALCRSMTKARERSELVLSQLTLSDLKRSGLERSEQVFTKGRVQRVKTSRPKLLPFDDPPQRQRELTL